MKNLITCSAGRILGAICCMVFLRGAEGTTEPPGGAFIYGLPAPQVRFVTKFNNDSPNVISSETITGFPPIPVPGNTDNSRYGTILVSSEHGSTKAQFQLGGNPESVYSRNWKVTYTGIYSPSHYLNWEITGAFGPGEAQWQTIFANATSATPTRLAYDGIVWEFSNAMEPITVIKSTSNPVKAVWEEVSPTAYNFPNGLGEFGLIQSGCDYKVVTSPTLKGSPIFWHEIVHPADGGESVRIPRMWIVDGKESPVFNLVAPANSSVTVEFAALPVELAVDANRDGEIKPVGDDSSDATDAALPFRFWLNDDIDRSHMVDGNDTEEDDLFTSPSGKLDWEDGQINSKRDLEDFARLKIYLGSLHDAVTQGTIKIGLKWKPEPESAGSPSLKVWRNLSPNGGTEYLTDETVAQGHLNLRDPGLVQGTTPYLIPAQYWTDIGLSASRPYGDLIFEGCSVGKGQLVVTLHNSDGTQAGEGRGVWIEFKSIEEFYERWTAGDGNGGDPLATAMRKKLLSRIGNSVSYGAGFEYAADAPEENNYILYVHGWNLQPEEKNRFAETAFKRLYWQGYKGRFGVFCWPATYNFGVLMRDDKVWKSKLNSGYSASTDPTNYDRGEWSAWKSSFPLMQLLNGQSGLRSTYPSLNVMAHSMGNVVVGEALRRLAHVGATNVVDCYVASQAALPAHSYDGTVASDLLADVPLATLVAYTDGGHPETPNIYPGWLAENSGAAGRRVNFYNVNDFALWHDAWEANQFLKPDGVDNPDQPWTYKYLGEVNVVQDLFKRRTPVWSEDLHLGDATIPRNRWEIMAFAAEARCRAVGAKDSTLGMNERVDLTTIWPDDSGLRGSDGQKWGAHKWHSAQFRSTNMRQGNYWKTLLGPLGFNLPTTP